MFITIMNVFVVVVVFISLFQNVMDFPCESIPQLNTASLEFHLWDFVVALRQNKNKGRNKWNLASINL